MSPPNNILMCDLCRLPTCGCYALTRKLQVDRIQEAVQAKLNRVRQHIYDRWIFTLDFSKEPMRRATLESNAIWEAMAAVDRAKKDAHNEWRGLKDSWL